MSYTRSISGLYKILTRSGQVAVKLSNPKYVPTACLTGQAKGQKFYQYTFIDEYSRFRFLEAFEEHNSYSSAQIIRHVAKSFHMPLNASKHTMEQSLQTALPPQKNNRTLFQKHLENYDVCHKVIKPFTPRHNEKVGRSHRKANERFYATHTFYFFDGLVKQLKAYNNRDYNNSPMRPLGWKSPRQVLTNFLRSV